MDAEQDALDSEEVALRRWLVGRNILVEPLSPTLMRLGIGKKSRSRVVAHKTRGQAKARTP
jgi:hypothetical protein